MSLGVSSCSGNCNIRGSDVSEKPSASIFRDKTDSMNMMPIFVLQTLVTDYKELNGVASLKALTSNITTDTEHAQPNSSTYLPCRKYRLRAFRVNRNG